MPHSNFQADVSAQQLADIIPHGLAIVNHDNELVCVNASFRELVPCSSNDFLNCLLLSIHSDDTARVNASIKTQIASHEALRIEYRARGLEMWYALDLKPIADEYRVAFGLGSSGAFIAMVTDISPEKNAEFLQRKIAQDAQENKHAQDRFIDMISHEIRNPLSAILHCTEDIVEQLRHGGGHNIDVSAIAESAGTITLCVTHQKKILDDVLAVSKIDASMLGLSPQRVQPQAHFSKVISLFRPQLLRNKIEFDYQADFSYADCEVEWVLADLDRMGQVLINLLSNAVKFTSDSKNERKIRVSIGASRERPTSYPPNVVFFNSGESELRLDCTASSEWGDGQSAYLMLAVKDTGIGIDDEAQIKLFERFNQATPRTERKYGGSGLGLNISRKLCHLHGGEIGVSSRGGEGATFGFFFRVRRASHQDDERSAEEGELEFDRASRYISAMSEEMMGIARSVETVRIPENPPLRHIDELRPGSPYDNRTRHTMKIAQMACRRRQDGQSQNETATNRRILVVEDNIINRRILCRKLKSSGFQVTEAENGQVALDLLQREMFDCVLMDQEMPVMDGNCATKIIRGLEKGCDTHIPILGVTANAREAQQSKMMQAGMDDIIHKPYSTEEIIAKIDQLTQRVPR